MSIKLTARFNSIAVKAAGEVSTPLEIRLFINFREALIVLGGQCYRRRYRLPLIDGPWRVRGQPAAGRAFRAPDVALAGTIGILCCLFM